MQQLQPIRVNCVCPGLIRTDVWNSIPADQRRYHLVNRALKHGELRRITRGLYVVDKRFRASQIHRFCIAQAIEPGSYVSAESALSFHGWIPESVPVTVSVTPISCLPSSFHSQDRQFKA